MTDLPACPTPEQRRPCHSHEPRNITLSPVQHTALSYARSGDVRVLISPCGPDAAVSASVEHSRTPYWMRRRDLPHWATYKALYKAGVVIIVRDQDRFPYDYKIVPNPEHPLNAPATSKENP